MKKLLVLISLTWMLAACAPASLSADEVAVLTPGAYAQPAQMQGTRTPPIPPLESTPTPSLPAPLVTNTPPVEWPEVTATLPASSSDSPTPTPYVDAPLPTATLPLAMPTATPLPSEPWQEPEKFNDATNAAIALLVDQLKVITPEQVSVASVESVQWPNSCMGCATPKQMCLMVLTPGYRILLNVGSMTYAVHTNRTGEKAVVCENSSTPPPSNNQK
ncbi:MAG: hypothetical protein JXA21_04205 [Anaerolineae bacterium]|nr:hypothetical protein [Anaerolineae bacterium]